MGLLAYVFLLIQFLFYFLQPPKKGSSKKPEKSRTPILIDGLTKDEMSKEQLEDHIMRLREELDREREERNYFQLERDKVHAFWDITDRKLKEANAELKNLDKELEETEIKLQVEIKVYRQKMRHLLCEHQNTICELNADGVASKEALQAEQTLLEKKLRNDLASLLVDIHQVDTETPIMELKKKHQEEMADMRAISEKKLQDSEAKNEKMHDELQLDLENKRKTEVSQVRDNWNKFISTLMEKDKEVYEEAKALLKNTEKKFDAQNELKQIVADESTNLNKTEKELTQVLLENKQVTENLTEIQEEIAVLQNKMKYKSKKFDNKKEIELNNLAFEHEMLQKKFKELQLEVAELHKTSAETIEKMKNKADAKHMQMEKKIQTLTDKIQKDLLFC
ncbi:dynein regulatory complex subunit 4 [Periophthalmus magnuspinnatus]|uniref:dynein regulatory complex subunit 4 n=1 Tax=Periophthalmus magnuspinnatus TaxID=409849 RepID=UPI0024370361|nr:dynein regulatory complex subunit 4 [Periophthalmus magnuspinnatus]